jgi:heme-degrading monooxygenase HmoA
MSVKIIIIRHVPKDKEEQIRPLLMQMRSAAHTQPGYISGETLVNYDDPQEKVVISTWKSLDNWNEWLRNPERRQLQGRVDEILGEETLYQVYYSG